MYKNSMHSCRNVDSVSFCNVRREQQQDYSRRENEPGAVGDHGNSRTLPFPADRDPETPSWASRAWQ